MSNYLFINIFQKQETIINIVHLNKIKRWYCILHMYICILQN